MEFSTTPLCPACSRYPTYHPRVTIPRLPLELWSQITTEVATLPEESEFERTLTFGQVEHDRNVAFQKRWKEITRDRLHLVLVCRYWHSVTIKYLHSSILILSTVDVRNFANLAKSPAIANRIRTVTVGRRLERSEEVQGLFQVAIERCVNLEVYSEPDKWRGFVPKTCPKLQSIRVTHFGGSGSGMGNDRLNPLLMAVSTMSSLRSLRLSAMDDGGVKSDPPIVVDLPLLELLQIELMYYNHSPSLATLLTKWLPRQTFPSLKTLLLTAHKFTTPCLLAFSKQLTTLSLSAPPERAAAFTPNQQIPFPRLSHLVFNYHYMDTWTTLPDVIELGNVRSIEISQESGFGANTKFLKEVLDLCQETAVIPRLKELLLNMNTYSRDESFPYELTANLRRRRPEVSILLRRYTPSGEIQCEVLGSGVEEGGES